MNILNLTQIGSVEYSNCWDRSEGDRSFGSNQD